MSQNAWEAIRFATLDELVTKTKLSGCAIEVNGRTTPEGYPFVVFALVASPGNEAVLVMAQALREQLSDRASWTKWAVRTSGG